METAAAAEVHVFGEIKRVKEDLEVSVVFEVSGKASTQSLKL
jgi:hypothetical protein